MISLAVAVGYVGAATLLLTAFRLREDPRLLARLERSRPSSRRGVLERVGARLGLPGSRARLGERLGRETSTREVDRLLGAKALLATAGLTVGLSALPAGTLVAASSAALLTVAGFHLPDFLAARREAGGRRAMEAEVSDLLDLVSVGVTAGLTPRLALDRASAAVRGSLGRQLASARDRVALGATWPEALREVAGPAGLGDLRRLAVILERAERFGTSVQAGLRRLARDVRSARWAREEERARRAPVVMLFPLVFLILPAFVLAAVVPVLLGAVRAIP